MQKHFHNLVLGVSVLPALLVMPAVAETISDYAQIDNQTVNWGNGAEDVTINNYVDVFNSGRLVVDAGNNGTINMNSDLWVVTQAKINGVYHGNTTTYSTATFTAKNVNFNTDGVALWVQNNTDNATDVSTINITADNINVNSTQPGIVDNDGYYATVIAMSQGTLNINGDTKITSGGNAILTRGYAHVNINEAANKKTQIDGNVVFNYKKATSDTDVDAFVNIGLNGSDSYWNGNTIIAWDDYKPINDKLEVNSMTLTLKDGALWNATKIRDFDEDYGASYNMGQFYTALNNLGINKGTVNIADTERGISVEAAALVDATFNGGPLNINEMYLNGGENTFNTDVIGFDITGMIDEVAVTYPSYLVVAPEATMNIGTNTVDVKNITLNGNMFATLREGNAQIKATSFDGNGKLNLTMTKVGTYNVFDVAGFGSNWSDEHVVSTNPIYELLINNDGSVVASKKSVEEIASNTGMTSDTAATISHVADAAAVSESKQLQELSVKIQEKLVENTPEAKAAVEHATKAINPETESVAQSVSTSVQNTVVSLASARMSSPSVGRNGGDVELTSGGVWAQGLFNKSKQNDAFNGYTRGIAVGMDGTINKDWTIGAGYSYAHSDINGTARNTEIDSNTIFVYGQYKPTEWYLNAIANYTMSDYSERGTILDGITVIGDYDVDSFGGALATGYDFANGVTPELGLRYMHVNANDYANSYGIKTHMDDTDFLTGVLGAKYAFNVAATKHLTFMPQLNAGVKYDLLSDKNIATVTMPGLNAYTLDGNRLKRIGGEFGVGLGMQYRELNVSVNYDIDVREDYTSQTGMLKFRYNF